MLIILQPATVTSTAEHGKWDEGMPCLLYILFSFLVVAIPPPGFIVFAFACPLSNDNY